MSDRHRILWYAEIILASTPLLIQLFVRPAAEHSDFWAIAEMVINSPEATVFGFILVFTTMLLVLEHHDVRTRDDVLALFLFLLGATFVLLLAIFCNVAFNVPKSAVKVTCFYNGAEAQCPYVMLTSTPQDSVNYGWLGFNLISAIIVAPACTKVRNLLEKVATSQVDR